jgi:ParB family chromosome partitioning protein
VARRSGLGRGLGALIPSEVKADTASALREIPVNLLEPNPHQPRTHFDEESLASLTASIIELGVLQPILVRQIDADSYEIIAGERRWRAAKRAGLGAVPALVRDADEVLSLEQALVENLHREDLNPMEEAAAYQQLLEDFSLTQDEVARRVGKSRSAVANTLRLFQLPPTIQRLVAEGQVSAGHAKALLGTPDRAFQEALARRIVTEGLTVREVEDAVRQRNELGGGEAAAKAAVPAGGRRLREPGLLELEGLLAEHLATRVSISMGATRGKVVVEFADLEDLERIYRSMVPGS